MGKFCTNCGNELKDGAMFCDKCGTKIGGERGEFQDQISNLQDIKNNSPAYGHKIINGIDVDMQDLTKNYERTVAIALLCKMAHIDIEQGKKEMDESYAQYGKGLEEKKSKKVSSGCLIVLIAIVALFVFVIAMQGTEVAEKKPDSVLATALNLDESLTNSIAETLTSCGIENVVAVDRDELLDNAHMEGEKGYRLKLSEVDNIILYLKPDNSVNMIRYADYDLYADGTVLASITDYMMTRDEMSKYQYNCEETIKKLLKSPKSAKFPSILEWRFSKNKERIIVQSYVDADNSFGANLRSEFQFTFSPDGQSVTSLIFDGVEYIQ